MQVLEQYFSEMQECIENFKINIETIQDSHLKEVLYTHSLTKYKKLFIKFLLSKSENELEENAKLLVDFTIEHEISYLYLYSELVTVVRNLLSRLLKNEDLKYINKLDQHFIEHEVRISILYLQRFLNKLYFKNEARLSHLSMMDEKKIMIYYEDHIKWVLSLIDYVKNDKTDGSYPELNHNLCEFGKWMHGNTTSYLISTSHFKLIEELHINLHDLGANVVKHSQRKNIDHDCKKGSAYPSTMIHLMQKIDHYSLEIGNEIAFLNQIEESAKDPLTHLLTRRLFDKIMLNKLDIAKETGRGFSLMMCDLDYFKSVNDNYGHSVGDVVLQGFAKLLENMLRKSDYVFRFGGEEFMVILPMTDIDEAHMLAQKVCDAMALETFVIDDISLHCTVSIGVIAVLLDNTKEINKAMLEEYMVKVDEKLYLAKDKGRNRVE
jgi:diguanylate cyclase